MVESVVVLVIGYFIGVVAPPTKLWAWGGQAIAAWKRRKR